MHFQHELDIESSDEGEYAWIGTCECGTSWQSNSRSEVTDEWVSHVRYLLYINGITDGPYPRPVPTDSL